MQPRDEPTAHTHDPTNHRTDPMDHGRGNQRGNVARLLALAVALFLLFPAPSLAGLLSEVERDHWSVQVIEDLAAIGVVDRLPDPESRLPLDRYELAKRTKDIRSLVDAIAKADFQDEILTGDGVSFDTVRTVRARIVAAELQLARARALADTLSPDEGEATLDLRAFERRLSDLAPAGENAWIFAERGAERLIDNEALNAVGEAYAELAQDIRTALESTTHLSAGLPIPSVSDVLTVWMRWLDGRSAPTRAAELERGITALEREYGRELALIDPQSSGWSAFSGLSESTGEASLGDIRAVEFHYVPGEGKIEGGLPLRAPVAEGAPSDGERAGAWSRVDFGWTPVTGIGNRSEWEHFSRQPDRRRIGAEYPLTVSNVEIRAGIGASYSVVDLDRLYEVAGGAEHRLSIGGTLPITGDASFKIGYEVRSEADAWARASERVVGAGLEYRFGDHTSLSASYSMIRFDAEDDTYRDNLGAARLEVRF